MILQRRGKNVAIAGAVLQFVFTAVMGVIWLWTGSLSAASCVLFLAGGVGLWLMAAVLFYCRQLQRREAMELEEIAAGGAASSSIFERADGIEVRPAAARAAWMERWALPVFTLLWAGYHFAVGALILRYLLSAEALEPANAAQGALFAVLIAFLAFLFSRYATGMASQSDWRLLRPGGSYLLVSAIFTAAVAVALLAAYQGYAKTDLVVAHVIPVVQFLLGAELVLNFVLDLYRPRTPGVQRRPSFDTRLFNYIAEPGRIGHSIAEALNYQFGFEVSKTWFYRLLSRAFVPLLVFAAVVLVAMSSVLIVHEGEQDVLLRWGKLDPARGVLRPGLHFKWPWPVDVAQRFDVGRVHEILLGAGARRSGEQLQAAFVKGREIYLWTQEHGRREELDFLLAVPPTVRRSDAEEGLKPPPVSIIKLVVPVQYLIEDVYKYGYRFTDARKLLECVAYRQMVRYAASATLDSSVGEGIGDRPEAIMTYGRQRAAAELKRLIQAAADELGLGVRITYVGLLAVHPPAEAAPAFEEVLQAERRQDEKRYKAEAEANRTLARVAGDPASALKLALAIRTLEELEGLRHLQTVSELTRTVDRYIRAAEQDIEALREEIERERLLGKLLQGGGAAKEQLLDEHLRHVEMLRRIAGQIDADGRVPELSGRIEQARRLAGRLFSEAAGEPAALVAQAVGYRWGRELTEQARAESFRRELLAFEAGPNIYMLDRRLDVLDEVLPGISKYVLGVDRRKIELWLNWEQQPEAMEGVTFQR